MRTKSEDTSILDFLPVAIGVINFKKKFEYINKEFVNLCGHDLADFTTISELFELIFNDIDKRNKYQRKLCEAINQIKKEKTSIRFYIKEVTCKDKVVKNIEINLKRYNKKGILYFGEKAMSSQPACKLKTTEPTKLQVNTKEHQDKIQKGAFIDNEQIRYSIFDSVPAILLLLNSSMEITRINKKGIEFIRKYGKDLNVNENKTIQYLFNETECPSLRIKKTIQNTINTGKPHSNIEVVIKSKTGRQVLLLSTSLILNNNLKEVLVTFKDISKQRETEMQLQDDREQAEGQDRLKTAFLRNISHEIRTPLNSILGFSGLLNKNIPDEKKVYYLDIIRKSSMQLLSVMDNAIKLSGIDSEEPEVEMSETDLNEVVSDLFFNYSKKTNNKNIIINTVKGLEYKKASVFTDINKVKEVLENLLNNAVKFTNEGYIRFGYTLEKKEIVFFVEDSGIGIDEENQGKIFEKFYKIDKKTTRTYEGEGLGLTIAKWNVKLLGGKIWLKSTPSKGAKFFFSIPYNPVYGFKADTYLDVLNPFQDEKPLVLIAEDKEINFRFIAEVLKKEQIEPLHAVNGLDAVEMCKKRKNIALVLMDIKMPVMDGYSALKEIKALRPELPVIAQTAYAYYSDKAKALNSGFNDYISKPIKKEKLIQLVKNYIPQPVWK